MAKKSKNNGDSPKDNSPATASLRDNAFKTAQQGNYQQLEDIVSKHGKTVLPHVNDNEESLLDVVYRNIKNDPSNDAARQAYAFLQQHIKDYNQSLEDGNYLSTEAMSVQDQKKNEVIHAIHLEDSHLLNELLNDNMLDILQPNSNGEYLIDRVYDLVKNQIEGTAEYEYAKQKYEQIKKFSELYNEKFVNKAPTAAAQEIEDEKLLPQHPQSQENFGLLGIFRNYMKNH